MGSLVRRVAYIVVAIVLLVADLGLLPAQPMRAAGPVVTNCLDGDGAGPAGSLRNAIATANANDTITFTPGLNCSGASAIPLLFTLTPTQNVTIDGTGATIVVDGRGAVQVFLVNSGMTVSVSNLTIQHGKAASFGGGIQNNNGGTLTVTNSTFTQNSAGGGGGIQNNNHGTLTVTNSTFSTNSASFGGGIVNGGTLTVFNSTLSGNTVSGAGHTGGGIDNSGGTGTVTNTILAGNTATSGATGPDANGAFASGGGNLIGISGAGSGNTGFTAATDQTGTTGTPLNPLLGTLGNYGGPTQTIPLLAGSPALGHGDPTVCARPLPPAPPPNGAGGVDQRGFARPVSSATPSQDFCAIGSFEPQPFAITSGAVGLPQATVGTAFVPNMAVIVKDDQTNPLPGYSVTFTPPVTTTGPSGTFASSPVVTTDSSGVAIAPTFTANTHAGTYNVTVNLTTNPLTTPVTFTLTNLPGPATTLTVAGYPTAVGAGTSNLFTVTALDQYGNTATGYTGTVRFTSTDTLASLPADYPFVAGDAGVHGFSASFGSAGTWNLIATDTTTNTITGTQAGITITPVATTTTLTSNPASAAHGTSVTFTATVAPATTTTLPTPTGTVAFTERISPSGPTTLLGTVALVNGVATLSTSTLTLGLHHLTATYTPTAPGPYTTSQGTQDVTITAAPLVSIAVTPARPTLKVGQIAQYIATATYADTTTADITSQVTWSSDTPGVATVDVSGKGTAVSPGTAHLTATQGSVSGQTTVTVTPPTPAGIPPAPAPASRPGSASEPGSGTPSPNPAPTGR